MRVLAVCLPSPGHVNPLLPLLRAFVAQGDAVLVASGEEAREAVLSAGATHHLAGRGFGAWFGELAGRIRGNPGEGLPPDRIGAYFVPRLFAEIAADDMIEPVLAAGREFRPDLVLFETEAFAGPLAAAVLGVPAVHLQVLLLPEGEVPDLVADALTPLWSAYGQPVDRIRAVYGDLLLATTPGFEPQAPPVETLALRPTSLPVRGPTPPPGDPVVHLTLGTILNQDIGVFRCVIDALADEPVHLVVTVGRNNDPGALGPVPPNTQVEQYLPHAELLPSCSAIVHHGGAGTMFASLAHALPQVVLPQGADQFANGAALEGAGLALVLQPGEVTTDRVREVVRRVLGDEGYRRRAADMAGAIAAMPGAADVAAELLARFGGGLK
jgi:hypothetical protein